MIVSFSMIAITAKLIVTIELSSALECLSIGGHKISS